MDDMICDAADIRQLRKLCVKYNRAKCHKCFHSSPNAGYDYPYCDKLTSLGKTNGASKGYPEGQVFKLKKATIPKTCKHWLSNDKEHKRLEDQRNFEEAQRAVNRVPKSMRKKLKL